MVVEKAQYLNYKLKFIGVYSKNNREFSILDVTDNLYGFTTVPIYDTLGVEATEHMFNQTELSTLFLTCTHISDVVKNMKSGVTPHLKNLVILDQVNLTDEIKEILKDIKYYTFKQVQEEGRSNIQPYPEILPEDISLFSYTSGTTGKPKGAMISHKALVACVAGCIATIPNFNVIHLSYLPLAHVLEKLLYAFVIFSGGQYCSFNGDIKKIKEDLAILRPTLFISVPRLFNKFYEAIKEQIRTVKGLKGYLANKAINSKLYYHQNGGYFKHKFYDTLVFNKVKNILGGRVQYMLTGSAPISTEVREFLKICFCCYFAEGYGQTEAVGAVFVTTPEDSHFGHVGGILPHNEFKLIDVPEMNYLSSNKDDEGRLCPQGEILIRGNSVIPGYYKNEAKTKESFDKDGWLHSGDIATLLPEGGALKIIDRRKNIFKLSQGEYVAPEKLEEVYKTVRGIEDIFIHGCSTKSCLIAILNLNKKITEEIAKELEIEGEFEELCEKEEIKEYFVKVLKEKCFASKFKGFERIKKVHIDKTIFQDHDLCTTSFKLKRHIAKNFYKAIFDKMYEDLD